MEYSLQKLSCQYNSGLVVASISGNKRVLSGNETQLQLAVANIGPISVAVDASSRAFRVNEYYTNTHAYTVHIYITKILQDEDAC